MKKNPPAETTLMSYLAAEAQNRNETPVDLAKHLGIGYVYLTQLLSGKKDTSRLGREILIAAAEYLRVPVAEAYLYAGALLPTDFVCEWESNLVSGDVLDVMARQPHWGGFVPKREVWESMPEEAKLFVLFAFESATGMQLIDKTAKTMIPEAD